MAFNDMHSHGFSILTCCTSYFSQQPQRPMLEANQNRKFRYHRIAWIAGPSLVSQLLCLMWRCSSEHWEKSVDNSKGFLLATPSQMSGIPEPRAPAGNVSCAGAWPGLTGLKLTSQEHVLSLPLQLNQVAKVKEATRIILPRAQVCQKTARIYMDLSMIYRWFICRICWQEYLIAKLQALPGGLSHHWWCWLYCQPGMSSTQLPKNAFAWCIFGCSSF